MRWGFMAVSYTHLDVYKRQVSNLFARWGKRGANKSFGFNGHTDVVPVGDVAAWTQDPFGAAVVDGWM